MVCERKKYKGATLHCIAFVLCGATVPVEDLYLAELFALKEQCF